MSDIDLQDAEPEQTFSPVTDADVDIDPDIEALTDPPRYELLPAKRGVCRVNVDGAYCGPAKDGRSFYCARHGDASPAATRINLGRAHTAEDPAQEAAREIRNRQKRYQAYILNDINPLLVQGAVFVAQVPEPLLDAPQIVLPTPDGGQVVIPFQPTLREQFQLTKKQAGYVAKSALTLEKSPMGKTIMMFAQTAAPYAAIAATLGVAGIYVFKLVAIRKMFQQLNAQMAQLQQMQQQQAANQAAQGTVPFTPSMQSDDPMADGPLEAFG